MPLSIAIDYTPALKQGGGIGRYARELVSALALQDPQTDYRLFVAGTERLSLPEPPDHNFSWRSTQISEQWLARIWHRARLPLPVEFFVGSIRLFHATDFVLPPTLPGTKTALTVHDLSFIRAPEATDPGLKSYLDKVVPRSAYRADHILADSKATKDDLMRFYNLPAGKITVLYSGVSSMFKPVRDHQARKAIRIKYQIGSMPYILSVGTIQPRKNYVRMIEAIAILRNRGYDIHYVIAGGKGWLTEEMAQTIKRLNMHQYVKFIGFVDEADLPALYSEALCFAFPSLYEGFGLPLLEAMACEVPVITSNLSSLPEVAGDAALMVDPLDVDAIAQATQRVLDNPTLHAMLIERGKQQIRRFTWEEAASQLRAIYRQILSK